MADSNWVNIKHELGYDEEKAKSLGVLIRMYEEMYNGSDRVCAILAGSIADESLRAAIAGKMAVSSVPSDLLLKSFVKSYESRIAFAEELKIIGETFKHDLKMIGKVRNAFAHQAFVPHYTGDIVDLSFDESPIKGFCNSMKVGYGISDAEFKTATKQEQFAFRVMEIAARMFNLRGVKYSTTLP